MSTRYRVCISIETIEVDEDGEEVDMTDRTEPTTLFESASLSRIEDFEEAAGNLAEAMTED